VRSSDEVKAEEGRSFSPYQEAARKIFQRRLRAFLVFAGVLLAAFAGPLWRWAVFALDSDTYSYVVLIPFVSAYLIWLRRGSIPIKIRYNAILSVLSVIPALVALVGVILVQAGSWALSDTDFLALTTACFALFLIGGVVLFFGAEVSWAILFPLLFLIFMVPFPDVLTAQIEIFFQHVSADMAHVLFKMTGTPVFRDGLFFQLPGITIQVAQECSGIRSSLVLFLASLVAGNLLLNSPWRRMGLALFIIPLAIFRNGFRILTIALLCVHISPDMIHSAIHKRGGPVFFALSLIPFFLVLLWMRRTEKR